MIEILADLLPLVSEMNGDARIAIRDRILLRRRMNFREPSEAWSGAVFVLVRERW